MRREGISLLAIAYMVFVGWYIRYAGVDKAMAKWVHRNYRELVRATVEIALDIDQAAELERRGRDNGKAVADGRAEQRQRPIEGS